MNDWLPKPPPTPAEWIAHYRHMAARVRDIAERAVTDEVRDKLLEVAQVYDELAEHVKKRMPIPLG